MSDVRLRTPFQMLLPSTRMSRFSSELKFQLRPIEGSTSEIQKEKTNVKRQRFLLTPSFFCDLSTHVMRIIKGLVELPSVSLCSGCRRSCGISGSSCLLPHQTSDNNWCDTSHVASPPVCMLKSEHRLSSLLLMLKAQMQGKSKHKLNVYMKRPGGLYWWQVPHVVFLWAHVHIMVFEDF